MRIAVVGVGGTGGYFGGLLARAGRDVTFIARGRSLEALRARGLTVKSQVEGLFNVAVNASDNPANVGPVDVVLFCVKAYDTDEAAKLIRPLVGPGTVVISVQNGIDNEERIAQILGQGSVLGGVAAVSSRREAPAVITVTQEPGSLRIGELFGGEPFPMTRLLEVLQGAGFGIEQHPDMRVHIWEKFVFICALSGLSAMSRVSIGSILQFSETSELYRGIMAEVTAVGQAQGVALPDDCVEQWLQVSTKVNPGIYGSMYYDLINGQRLELGSLNGSVVRLGRGTGVATPLNFAVYAALRPFENGIPTHA